VVLKNEEQAAVGEDVVEQLWVVVWISAANFVEVRLEWRCFKRSSEHFVASRKLGCPKRFDVLSGKPSFQAAGFRRGFMGLGSCARVTLPSGRTAFLAFLLADLSLETVPFGSGYDRTENPAAWPRRSLSGGFRWVLVHVS